MVKSRLSPTVQRQTPDAERTERSEQTLGQWTSWQGEAFEGDTIELASEQRVIIREKLPNLETVSSFTMLLCREQRER